MKVKDIIDTVGAEVLECAHKNLDAEIEFGFASDLLSDVLTLKEHKILLITGLSNLQTIRTAEMADIDQILLVRNKPVSVEMCKLAKENNILLMRTEKSMFKTIGLLYNEGLKPLY